MRSQHLPGPRPSARHLSLGGAAFLGLLFFCASCSNGGDAASAGGPMYIESCSLGCGNGVGGQQVSCSIVNVGRNVEITVLFSEPVALSSVNSSTVRIINTTNGGVPVGTYTLDSEEPRRLIFRPALTFDEVGNPIFALADDETYEITIPGLNQGDNGPFLRSVNGRNNQSRLQCTIRTTEGLLDPVPGSPTASAIIEKRKVGPGEVLETWAPAHGASDVSVLNESDEETIIRVEFDDIMNPATLANLSTGQSSTITVKIDPDGNTVDATDQVVQAGFFTVVVDFERLRTTLEFTPSGGFPTGGSDPAAPRAIVMSLPSGLLDLVGNQLSNPGSIVFRPEIHAFPPVVLPDDDGEDFADDGNHDVLRSGADWGGGRLTYGAGGGAGRHGDLVVKSGTELTLDTDSQLFPIPGLMVRSLLDNAIPGVDYDPLDPGTWPTLTETGGNFEFSRLWIKPNGRLILSGSNPGRLFSRGPVVISGTLDIAGTSAPAHRSNSGKNDSVGGSGQETAAGGIPGLGGPTGGDGGKGAARYDHTSSQVPAMLNAGGILNPTHQNPNNAHLDGEPGGGVGGGASALAAGVGGVQYPETMPTCNQITGTGCPGGTGFGNAEFSSVLNPDTGNNECKVAQVAGPGSGGGYALSGGAGVPMSPHVPVQPGVNPNVPPNTPGGDSADVIDSPPGGEGVRLLEHEQGNLRGGAGGGGAGCHIWGTEAGSGVPPNNCLTGIIFPYFDHSSAGGGGGGGAVQLVSGKRLTIAGTVDASGGDGGSATGVGNPVSQCQNVNATNYDCEEFASPGGGGAGGAIKLQALVIELAQLPGRLTVAGGSGGVGVGGSLGGDGGPGLVRLEFAGAGTQEQEAPSYAPLIAPYLPTEPGFNDPFVSAAILSIGEWGFQRFRPTSFSAGMSCWMKAEGNFFVLDFAEDDAGAPDDPEAKGWNMEVLYDTGANGVKAFPYRGLSSDPDFPLVGMDFETFLGQLINHDEAPGEGSLFAVRFQGARATGALADPCDVELSGFESEIQPGSLTPWVRHPDQLNLFLPKPNMVRFCVVFEEFLKTQGPIQFRIQGVTGLKISVNPD